MISGRSGRYKTKKIFVNPNNAVEIKTLAHLFAKLANSHIKSLYKSGSFNALSQDDNNFYNC